MVHASHHNGDGIHVAVVLPCYKSRDHVLDVLSKMPAMVGAIYCVDDGCPDKTGDHISQHCTDRRVRVINHSQNKGVGGAMITGYRQALADGANIIVKVDSDAQMDPALIPHFVTPIAQSQADYTKGNRFYNPEFLSGMPKTRLLGNAGLSFLSKFSTGYWQIFDPVNGYTAIHADVLRLLPLDKIDERYFFESDMLFRLGTLRAVVLDIPQKAIYGDEKSNLKIFDTVLPFAAKHMRNFLKRIVYNYFVRDFHVASIEWILGPALFMFGLLFGLNAWMDSTQSHAEATPGTVMLAALPLLTGLQLMLSALHFDIESQPKTPLHTLIGKDV